MVYWKEKCINLVLRGFDVKVSFDEAKIYVNYQTGTIVVINRFFCNLTTSLVKDLITIEMICCYNLAHFNIL